MTALAVGCHPDDIEFMMSGTLFLLRGPAGRYTISISPTAAVERTASRWNGS